MSAYVHYLTALYPQGRHYAALLPKGDAKCKQNLSAYGLKCLGLLGEGSFSRVYHVKDKKTRQLLACKVARFYPGMMFGRDRQHPAEAAQCALQEILIAKELTKKHVHGTMPILRYTPHEAVIRKYVRLLRFFPFHSGYSVLTLMPVGIPYQTFMEELFHSGRRLTNAQGAALLLDLCEPLQHMQQAGICHRDIKPQNIMLLRLPNGQVRAAITDFNISKPLGQDEIDTSFTLHNCTPRYAHPDHLRTQAYARLSRTTAQRYDIYSLGVIAYMLFSFGDVPPKHGHIPPPRNAPSPQFSSLILRMLSEDIDRVPECSEVVSELYRLLGSSGGWRGGRY